MKYRFICHQLGKRNSRFSSPNCLLSLTALGEAPLHSGTLAPVGSCSQAGGRRVPQKTLSVRLDNPGGLREGRAPEFFRCRCIKRRCSSAACGTQHTEVRSRVVGGGLARIDFTQRTAGAIPLNLLLKFSNTLQALTRLTCELQTPRWECWEIESIIM